VAIQRNSQNAGLRRSLRDDPFAGLAGEPMGGQPGRAATRGPRGFDREAIERVVRTTSGRVIRNDADTMTRVSLIVGARKPGGGFGGD